MERPNVGGVCVRNRNGAPSRHGCVVNGKVASVRQATHEYAQPAPPQPPLQPPLTPALLAQATEKIRWFLTTGNGGAKARPRMVIRAFVYHVRRCQRAAREWLACRAARFVYLFRLPFCCISYQDVFTIKVFLVNMQISGHAMPMQPAADGGE